MKHLSVVIIICLSFFGLKLSGQNANFSISPDSIICAPLNDSVIVTFTALYNVGSKDTTYKWNLGNDSIASGKTTKMGYRTGLYTISLTLSAKNGFNVTLKRELFIRPRPNANFTIADTFSLAKLDYVFRSGKSQDSILKGNINSRLDSISYAYHWTLYDSTSAGTLFTRTDNSTSQYPYRDTLTHIFSNDGHYLMHLKVNDYFGCSDSFSLKFYVAQKLQIPNAFSPNGDHINDFFIVHTNGRTEYSLKIFTQTGILVFKTEATSIIWDGRSVNGAEASPGAYYYVIEPIKNPEGQTKRTGYLMLFK